MPSAAEPREAARPSRQLPEPGRFWVRYVPRTWETPDRPWVHLAVARLGDWSRRGVRGPGPATLESLSEIPLDDVLYLPPVPPKRAGARDDLATARLVDGTPVLVHLFPGEESRIPPVQGVTFVFDLLAVLLEGEMGKLDRLPTGASVAWPLVPGLTDDPSLWDEGCRRLASSGARCAQALAPLLVPADRRRLLDEIEKTEIEKPDEVFGALFHREAPSEREFARVAHRHGLDPFLPRPLPRAPIVGRENRRIGEVLALTAELWLRLGRPVEQGQAFYRAARWVDETTYDMDALAREGNLAVIPALDERSREIAAEVVETEASSLLDELLREYLT
ncbi:MAG TPA: hypothetical protein VN493_29060 [Thermoanaerobaculia bacterium]|nr:hypothetical protein [Thermoanaerobaculia bacterium]